MESKARSKVMRTISKVTICFIILGMMNLGAVLSAVAATTKKPAAGLVEFVRMVYAEKWDYVWGGINSSGVDCSGMIYCYAGGPRTSWEQFEQATQTGTIDTMPDIPGVCLWRPGHVGVYIGDGMEIDARNSSVDVVLDSVYKNGKTSWTHWYMHSNIEYSTNIEPPETSSAPDESSSKQSEVSSSQPEVSSETPEESSMLPETSSKVPETSSELLEEASLIPIEASTPSVSSAPPESSNEEEATIEFDVTPTKPESSMVESSAVEEEKELTPDDGFVEIGVPDIIYSYKTFDEYFMMYDITRILEKAPENKMAGEPSSEEYFSYQQRKEQTIWGSHYAWNPEISIV